MACAAAGIAGSPASLSSKGWTWAVPLAATTPNSAACPRNALIAWVRCAHQHLAMLEDDQLSLVLGGLDRDRGHAGPRCGVVDRLGVGSIVLGASDEGPDVLRRDQAHLMAKPGQHATPMMRATARLHDHLGAVELAEDGLHLRSLEVAPQHWTLLFIYAVKRENVL